MRVLLPASLVLLCVADAVSGQCELERLDGSHLPFSSQFGIGIDVRGDRAIIGDWFYEDDGTGTGWATVYQRAGITWAIDDVFTPGDPDEAFSTMFGESVAIEGDWAIVGAPGRDLVDLQGKAYVYQRVGGVWELATVLSDPLGADGDDFGIRVALSGDRALIYDSLEYSSYELVAGQWVENGSIVPPVGQSLPSLALDGDTAVMGYPTFFDERAYVYRHDGHDWHLEQTLTPNDAHPGQTFGQSVDVEGDLAVVGASGDDTAGFSTGAAYVFARSGTTWSQVEKLLADDGAQADYFGVAVSVAARTILVGAYLDDDNGEGSGAAYVFESRGAGWEQTEKLLPSTAGIDEGFGWRVATDGVSGLVTAPHQGPGPGSVFSFALGGPDCNGNAEIDACDIELGTSHDFDVEGTPDECQPLSVDTPLLSVSAGGTQTLSLDAGEAFSGDLYVVLGSLTGTSPGTAFGPVHVPLNLDAYTTLTIVGANSPPFANTLATFDSRGQSTASITLDPLSNPSLAGLVLDHAFVVVRANAAASASNAMPLDLLP